MCGVVCCVVLRRCCCCWIKKEKSLFRISFLQLATTTTSSSSSFIWSNLPNFMLNSFSPTAAAASVATIPNSIWSVCVCSSDSMVFIVLLISNRLIEHRLSHDNIRFHLRFFFLIRLQVFAMLRTRAIVLRFKACFVFRRVYSLEFYNRFSCSFAVCLVCLKSLHT